MNSSKENNKIVDLNAAQKFNFMVHRLPIHRHEKEGYIHAFEVRCRFLHAGHNYIAGTKFAFTCLSSASNNEDYMKKFDKEFAKTRELMISSIQQKRAKGELDALKA